MGSANIKTVDIGNTNASIIKNVSYLVFIC